MVRKARSLRRHHQDPRRASRAPASSSSPSRSWATTVTVRDIDRSELYIADEVFLCGTGAQVMITSIDHRPVGTGEIGDHGHDLKAYFDAVRGRIPAYSSWLTPVY
ncbi:MAG: hypothetical protein U0869_13460 [Chloroflexota bacterium]